MIPWLWGVRTPHDAGDLRKLIDVTGASEQGGVIEQLRQYAAERPHVDFLVVVTTAVENFRSFVPLGSDLKRELPVLFEYAGLTEVRQLQVAVWINKEIRGLDISVHQAYLVKFIDTFQHGVHQVADLVDCEGPAHLTHQLV